MDHRTFLSSLSPEDRARLTARADGPGVLWLAAHLAVITLLAAGVATGAPFWPLLLPPLGIALAFLFTIEHECTHQTPFATTALNEAAGFLTGFLIVQPFLWFRYFHLAHHRFTNDPERDPELLGKPKPESWAAFAWHLSSLKYWRGKVVLLLQNAFGEIGGDFTPERAKPALRREARIMLTLYALALASLVVTPLLFWIWLLPLSLGFPVLRLYLLAEHGRCPAVADMFDNTRTTFTNRIVRFFAWNMPYHAEHHVFPAVPFHRLPELHARAAALLKRTSDGYSGFTREYVAGFVEPNEEDRA